MVNVTHSNPTFALDRVAMRKGKGERKRGMGSKTTWLIIACNALFVAFLFHAKYDTKGAPCKVNNNSGANNPSVVVGFPMQSNSTGGDSFALARSQSFGFFYDITEEHWRLSKQLYLKHENHRYPDKPLTYNPQATSDQADPKVYASKNNHPGFSSYAAWYQNVSII